MTTKNMKNGSNTTTATTNTEFKHTAESKFTEEPQSKEVSSDSGQSYMSVDDTPFAIVKKEDKFVIILAADIVSSRKFDTLEEAEAYIKEKPWELLWATTMWVMMNQEEIKTKLGIKKQ